MAVETAEIDDEEPTRRRKRYRPGWQKILIAGVMLMVAAGGMIVSPWLNQTSTKDDKPLPRVTAPRKDFARPPEPTAAVAIQAEPDVPLPTKGPLEQLAPKPLQASVQQQTGKVEPIPYTPGIFARVASTAAPPGASGAAGGLNRPAAPDDELTARLQPSNLGGVTRATLMRDPELTLPRGRLIPCNLETDINSQLPGFVTCITREPVLSATGTVVLLDKGTQVFGYIRSGVRQGQNRVFILWESALTPNYVEVALRSPGADELGAAGVTGEVDTHFWERFWAVTLFSIIDAAPQLATAALQNNGNSSNVNFNQFATPQQQLAGTILSDTMHIPPTLHKNHGETVTIFLANKIEFSDVYTLRRR